MKFKLFTLLTISLFTLNACGGGDSSSGANAEPAFEDDGVYDGTQNLTIFDPDGSVLDSQDFSFNMSVFQNNVTISDPSFSAQAPISDGIFIASSGEFVEGDDDVTCTIVLIYNGTIGLGSAQGTIQGNYLCSLNSGLGSEVSFPVDGSFDSVRGTVSSKVSMINDIELDLSSTLEVLKNTSN